MEVLPLIGLTLQIALVATAIDVPLAVGLYITAAYWFTASTSFANPAVTIARAFTDTFSGIRPVDAPAPRPAPALWPSHSAPASHGDQRLEPIV